MRLSPPPPHAAAYVRISSIVVLALYLAYLALLAALAGLSCRRGLTRADGYFVLLTLSTLGTVAAGVATNTFVPVVDRSGAYLGAYACANLCVAWAGAAAAAGERPGAQCCCSSCPPQLRHLARRGLLARVTH